MLKILSYNLLIISFVLISCAKKDESSTTTSSYTYATSKSGVTASGSMTVGSDTVSGTYASVCAAIISGGPSDATHVGWLIVITGSSTFTKEVNFYTDSACTSLSLGWYYNNTSVVVGDASGSDYKVTYTQTNNTIFANTTAGETYIEAAFGGLIDVTVGTESVITLGIPFYNLIKVSGTNFYFGSESPAAYPSELSSMAYVKQ